MNIEVADCGICGRTVSIVKPLPEPGAILRTRQHNRPDGTRCVVTQVDKATLRWEPRPRRKAS